MDIDVTVHYPAPAEQVFAMITDPEYTRTARLAQVPIDPAQVQVDVNRQGEATVVVLDSPVPQDLIPAQAARFVPAGMRAVITETWQDADAQGVRSGSLALGLGSLPVKLQATQELVSTGQTTERRVRGTLKVSIPIVGGAIEKAAASHVETLLRGEEDAARTWLAQH